jgi:hypothetical protein
MQLYSPLSTAIAWHFAADCHFRAVCQSISVRTLCSNQAESSPFTKWVGSTSPAQPQSCGLSSSSVPMCNFQPLSEISCFSQDLILSAFLRTIMIDNRYRSLLFSSRQTARSIHYHLPEMEQWTDQFSSPAPPSAFFVPLLVWGWWQRIRNRHFVLIVLHFASL